MVTESLVREFHSDGFVRVPAAFAPAAADKMRVRVWRHLAARGISDSDPSTWPRGRDGKASSAAARDRAFASFWSKDVVAAVDGLLGAGCWAVPASGDVLLTFPEPAEPLRRLDPFHSDFAMDIPGDPLFAIEIFAFIAAVTPRGGGTLIIRRSHRVAQRYLDALPQGFPRNRAALQFTKDNPWVRTLDDAGLIGATHDCDGIEVRVEELTGEPGDVIITHPWTFHAGVSSQGSTPRMMLRHRIFRSPG